MLELKIMSEDRESEIEFDLSRRETEAGWIRIVDNFALKGTPVWFSWIGWLLALSALQFLYDKSKNLVVGFTVAVSVGMLWIYFQAFFFRIKFKGLPLIKNEKIAEFISIAVSSIIAYVFWSISIRIVKIVIKNQ